ATRQGDRARTPVAGQAEVDWREDRYRRRQIWLHSDRRPLARQACQGAWPSCGKGQERDPGDQLKPLGEGQLSLSPDVQLTIRRRRWFDPAKSKRGEMVSNPARILSLSAIAAVLMFVASAGAQEVRHFRFAHDQQLNSGYSIAYDIFSAKLKELSK